MVQVFESITLKSIIGSRTCCSDSHSECVVVLEQDCAFASNCVINLEMKLRVLAGAVRSFVVVLGPKFAFA